jgi:hypothetical protein
LAIFNFVIYLLAKCLPTSNPNKNIIDMQKVINQSLEKEFKPF